MIKVTVIICTHQPDRDRLTRTLGGLAIQSFPSDEWETLLVDNASTPALQLASLPNARPANLRIVPESQLGLTAARRCGLRAARGEFCVLVDDDNVLAPDYLATVHQIFAEHPRLGAAGGPSLPEFESPPPAWTREFFPLLALREHAAHPQIVRLKRSADGSHVLYPECAPIGAGMALRRSAVQSWLESSTASALSDRRGSELTSGGDNDIVLTLLHAGWEVGYIPSLSLTHLIPASRLQPAYLARLNRGIRKSWTQVLSRHDANPWPAIPTWTLPLRRLKAWFVYRAWAGPSQFIRWQGACGHFEGLASLGNSR